MLTCPLANTHFHCGEQSIALVLANDSPSLEGSWCNPFSHVPAEGQVHKNILFFSSEEELASLLRGPVSSGLLGVVNSRRFCCLLRSILDTVSHVLFISGTEAWLFYFRAMGLRIHQQLGSWKMTCGHFPLPLNSDMEGDKPSPYLFLLLKEFRVCVLYF